MKRTLLLILMGTSSWLMGQTGSEGVKNIVKPAIRLPQRGLCAHRGAMETHPENTLPAFRQAVRVGAQMIEFDVFLTKDQQMVVIHDSTVDRTTNGTGKVSDFTLNDIKKLDAGSWKAPAYAGERIPTLEEVLQVMPWNIWLNIHIKDDGRLPELVAGLIAEKRRLHQAFLACGAAAAQKARTAAPAVLICCMERQESERGYVLEAMRMKADFIQLRKAKYPGFDVDVKTLKQKGIRINYFGTNSPEEVKELLEQGVDFPLVNDIAKMIDLARKWNIQPVEPLFSQENGDIQK